MTTLVRTSAAGLGRVKAATATCAMFIVACASSIPSSAAGVPGAASLPVVEVAEGVYVHTGRQEDPSPANRGDIANLSFVVGSRCVAVIDTGGSAAVGSALRGAVRDASPLPVCYVINTHVHPDHLFGNAAFEADGTQFVGHARLPAAIAARGSNYLRAAMRDLGDAAEGTRLIAPTIIVADERAFDLGGRVLTVRAWPTAHTDDDLSVRDDKTDTLWLSDLLFVDRIPSLDGSLRGWLSTIRTLRSIDRPRHVIPGHGPVDPPWPGALLAEERYLSSLADGVRAAIRDGRTMQQAVDSVGTDERDRWLLFDSFRRRNVTAAFAELEWEN